MIYYAVFYLSNGEIHLKPYNSREGAEGCVTKMKQDAKYGPQITFTRVVKKDPRSAWLTSVNGYWI